MPAGRRYLKPFRGELDITYYLIFTYDNAAPSLLIAALHTRCLLQAECVKELQVQDWWNNVECKAYRWTIVAV
jgi:hypothetical protein